MIEINERDAKMNEEIVKEIAKTIKKYEKECFYNNEASDSKEIKKIIERLCKWK